MRILVFRAGDGRSILIEGSSHRHHSLLVDGGTTAAYNGYVAPTLGEYATIAWVCVSAPVPGCVDGVRQLLDDVVAWRVYDYQRSAGGNSRYRRPSGKRPPMPKSAWFNPLHTMLGVTSGELQGQLAAYANVFARRDGSSAEERVVASLRESQQLSRRLSQLRIPCNEPFGGGMVHARRTAEPWSVGTLAIHLLAPLQPDIEQARSEWMRWFQEAAETPLQLIASHAAGRRSALMAAPTLHPSMPSQRIEQRPPEVPSIPSQVLLVKEGESSVLLAGQATADEVLRGLASQGWTNSSGLARVSVLEVPSRGGARFAYGEFFKRIVADDYVFHGDTATIRAAPEMVEALLAARADNAAPAGDKTLRLWFACHPNDEPDGRATAIRGLQAVVKDQAKASSGRVKCMFPRSRASALELRI